MNVTYALPLPTAAPAPLRFHRPALAAGYLAAYADSVRGARDRHIVLDPEDLDSCEDAGAVASAIAEAEPDVVALSVYVWNREEVAAITGALRNLVPELVIVAGGPEVAYEPARAIEDLQVDWVCTGEGEIAFTRLLDVLEDGGRAAPAGMVSARSPGDVIAPAPTVSALDDIPSPYGAGQLRIAPDMCVDLETTRGCPFNCSFCLYGKQFSHLRYFSLDRVAGDVGFAISHGARHIYLMDPTFNFPPARCMELCALLEKLNPDGAVTFYTEARAEIVTPEMAEAFARAGIRHVEVGLQATNRQTLSLMKRGLGAGRFVRGCRLLHAAGVRVEIGIIVGLPGDDAHAAERTAEWVIDNELGHLDVYRLQVLPGTEYRQSAADLGLSYDDGPPYYIRGTSEMTDGQITATHDRLRERAREANAGYASVSG